jgi:hypothetical protein
LEIILSIAPAWIKKLRTYINDGKIEFIGSGYSQIIGPLSPAKLNEWNLKLGHQVYENILGIKPKAALINEMAYSAGIVEHYTDAEYDAIIMEWNNPRKSHPGWENECRYFPQKAIGADGRVLPVIWADSIAFQKFQRFAHAENDLDEYIQYLKIHNHTKSRFFPLYCNDVEIFNFRPNRYKTEEKKGAQSEYERIFQLYNNLENEDWVKFVFPSEVFDGLSLHNGGNEIKLESPDQPIPVKKQEKYNINRWALTGRNDMSINTVCYQVFDALIREKNDNPDDWKELCYLWSSDFRTHITEIRWDEFLERLHKFRIKWSEKTADKIDENFKCESQFIVTESQKQFKAENDNLKIVLNKNKGCSINEFVFKELSDKSLFGTLNHGYYDDISFGADYYSGHAIIEIPGEHKVADLSRVKPEILQTNGSIILTSKQKWGDNSFQNKISIYNKTLIINKNIEIRSDKKSIIRPVNFTFNPEAWDWGSLYVETHNGGNDPEKFFPKGQNIAHRDIYSSLISARHAFGNTEGHFIVGDKNKSIMFECDMTLSALIPSIDYSEMGDTYYFRLQYSAREMDETTRNIKFDRKLSIKLTY